MRLSAARVDAQKEGLAIIRKAAGAVLAAILIGMLYFGREVFVPIAMAVLLSFVLAPPVHYLQRIRVPRAIAAIGVVLITFAGVFALGGSIATQVSRLSERLPEYQSTMRHKIESLRGITAGTGTLERAASMLQDLSKELDKPRVNEPRPSTAANPFTPSSVPEQKPIPVEIRQPDPGVLATVGALIAPLINPLTTTGITVIFVIFILLMREDIRNRFIRLAGSHDLQQTTLALDDAGSRLSKLFLTQLGVNAVFGLVIGCGLWVIGIPNAALWGILGTILRFVPYIGAVIAAAFPLVLAVAVDPGWSMLLWTAALFLVVEPVMGQVVEPLVYGHSTGLSPLAIVLSATFWTWLWGPIGLVLATPLTICLVVLGRHVEQLEFLNVLLGDEPALSPEQMFYQRMLANDPAEAADQAEHFLDDAPLPSYYDTIAAPGLRLAQADLQRKALDTARLMAIRDTVSELVEDLADYTTLDAPPDDTTTGLPLVEIADDAVPEEKWRAERAVLCIAGRSALDHAAAMLLQDVLVKSGFGAAVEPASAMSTAQLFRLSGDTTVAICLSYMDHSTPAPMRLAVRRLRRRLPNAHILLCCWTGATEEDDLATLREIQADAVATTYSMALAHLRSLGMPKAMPTQPAAGPIAISA